MVRSGLNVPIITVLDDSGQIIEMDQRQVIRHVIQDGKGANSVFLSGTTGEFDKLQKKQRQRIIEIGCEEIYRYNQGLSARCSTNGEVSGPVEAWAGVTAPTKAETLENLALAIELKANLAVIAPMTINDLTVDEIVPFFKCDVAAIIQAESEIPIALYDNPDIAAGSTTVRHIPATIVETLSKLPFVVCLKASTSRAVLQDHMRVLLAGVPPASLDIFVGNAHLMFEYEVMQREAGLDSSPLALAGVVSGPGNVLPCEWRTAWQAVIDRDDQLLRRYQEAFERFDRLCFFRQGSTYIEKKIAAIKEAMYYLRIISSPCVAPGTLALTESEAQRFDVELASFLVDLHMLYKTKQARRAETLVI